MFAISEIIKSAPASYSTSTQQEVYKRLSAASIPFERVDTDPGITMEQCVAIGDALGQRVVKTLLLCNRQQTQYYLLAMNGEKPFVTKDFSKALGVSRVSFAPESKLEELLGTQLGATSILTVFNAPKEKVRLILEREVTESTAFACTDGTATCFIKLPTSLLLERYLPATGHSPEIIDL